MGFPILVRPRFNIKMSSYQYRKSHCGDKTVLRSSYLHNGISYTGKMTSLYWIRAQFALAMPGLLQWKHTGPWFNIKMSSYRKRNFLYMTSLYDINIKMSSYRKRNFLYMTSLYDINIKMSSYRIRNFLYMTSLYDILILKQTIWLLLLTWINLNTSMDK